MKKLVLSILILFCFLGYAFSGETIVAYKQKFNTMSQLTKWFTVNKYQVRHVRDYTNLPLGASQGSWLKLNSIEYNCYIFTNEDDYKKFNERYIAMTYRMMVHLLQFKHENAKKIANKTEFKSIYNAKCATNPGNVPL